MDNTRPIKMYGQQTLTAGAVEDEPAFLYVLDRARAALDAAAHGTGRRPIAGSVQAQLFIECEPSAEARRHIADARVQVVTPHAGLEDLTSRFARLVVTADCAFA